MADRKENIQKLLEMQRKFIELDRQKGVSMQEYFAPSDDSPLKGFKQDYTNISNELVDQAHELKASKR